MKNFFDEAVQAARRGEQLSREADIEAFKALMSKDQWNEADMDAATDLWQRAERDGQLNACMEALQSEWLQREGLEVTPEDVAQAQKIVNRVFREYFEES